MVNPVTALIIFGIVCVTILLFFFFKNNISHLLKRVKSDNTKILLEDALKYLYDRNIHNQTDTNESISSALKMSGKQASQLMQMLSGMNFAIIDKGILSLTEEGRNYALKIVRIHRLLEKYLAEETSIKEDKWHIVAEDREHSISDSEADFIAAKLGNPLIDPHGDPIPGPYGEYDYDNAKSLLQLSENSAAKIIHIEDEPPRIYSQILTFGLHAGSLIKVLGIGKNQIFLEADGIEVILPKEAAGNISVVILQEDEIIENFKRLSELKMDHESYIAGISKALRGQQRRRLLDLGFVPGAKIAARLTSLAGDPIGYEIRGALIALRRQQADLIFIKDNVEDLVNA